MIILSAEDAGVSDMAKLTMNSSWKAQVTDRTRPGMEKLAKEMLDEWIPTIPVGDPLTDKHSGEMKAGAYATVDESGTITIGSKTHDGHALFEEMGTSNRPAHHTLLPVVTKDRGRRDV